MNKTRVRNDRKKLLNVSESIRVGRTSRERKNVKNRVKGESALHLNEIYNINYILFYYEHIASFFLFKIVFFQSGFCFFLILGNVIRLAFEKQFRDMSKYK